LLRKQLLNYSVRGGEVVPRFLDARDLPWVRRLLDEVERNAGQTEAELAGRLRAPIGEGVDPRKHRLAAEILLRLVTPCPRPLEARAARARLFSAAAVDDGPHDATLARVAAELGVAPPELMDGLFGDLPGQRLVAAAAPLPSPDEIALRANLALARGLLERASAVSIELEGNARAIVRQAKLRRLICGVRPRGADSVTIEVSGPFALFRHTLVYGRALGELLPLLAWCRRYRLRAHCVLGERSLTLELGTGDPIVPSGEPRRFDSKVEERFFRDFGRQAPRWTILREPQAIAAGPWLLFPDFLLEHRSLPGRQWTLEIIGFWTERYLERKLAAYRAANIQSLILCVSEDLGCSDGALPAGAQIVRYRRAIDVRAVLGIIEGRDGAPRAVIGRERTV
jgi:uncharacterized protein